MRAPRALGLPLLLVLLGAAGVARAEPVTWTASTDSGQILVHVYKRGLFSGLAHDHHFSATDWQVTAVLDPAKPGLARVEVVVAAGSLRDQQAALTEKERDKVNGRAAGPETLDAARYPEIRFVADRLAMVEPTPIGPEGGLEGDLVGTLSMHGVSRPLEVPIHATRDGERWRVTGTARIKQSQFGIEPFSGFAGTVSVHDEAVIEFDLQMSPAPMQPRVPPSGL
jgi:polyisoprenoid-binding protein YceI